ncbi:EAL domain-containing protein [Rhodanobacter ginsengisoli]|uniref:cyclic-guanylate-specific phosphodiesterase n=2 Tax=Rhodanobacter ginsengisoli TaxID=418646 RepID=A0ABW0QPE5_9GAMM
MRSRKTTPIAVAITLLAVGLPVLAALWLAHRESRSEASAQTQFMAGEVLGRAEGMADQAMAAYRRMRALTTPPCSDTGRQQMIAIALDYSYLKAVGHVADDRVECSSFAPGGDGSRLGGFAYTSMSGVRIAPRADLGTGKRFLVLEKDDFVAAALPEVLVDLPFNRIHISSGVFGRSAGPRLAGNGTFDPAWRERLGQAHQATFVDGDNLVTIRVSSRYDLAGYSAIPATYLHARAVAFALVLVPIGLLLGGAGALASLYLVRKRASLPAVLRTALRKMEFVLHYQPIVELASGRMVGAEALLRWPRHDGSQVMRPDAVIRVAEDCGLIRRLTVYVLAQLATEAPAFIRQHPDGYISINLSPSDLHDEDILEQLRQLIETPGIAARNLVVEITEHSFLDPTRASRNITAIRALGIRVAIDDFGTGFSGLSHLATLKTDYLKIDKVFVDTIGTDSATSEVALHIVRIAHSLGLTVIAEGIESRLQADLLREQGVEYAQGWLFSHAQPMEALLRGQAAA